MGILLNPHIDIYRTDLTTFIPGIGTKRIRMEQWR